MEENFEVKEYYTLSDIAQFSGLSDRTLRNYLAKNILEGTKIDGVWRFSAYQVEQFIKNPIVRPSILAKNNAIIYDFLLDRNKGKDECVVVLDISDCEKLKTIEYFCSEINSGSYRGISFSFDAPFKKDARIILKGNPVSILQLLNGYYKEIL